MLSQEQLETRRLGIGSSDIAAIAGEDPFRSALDVYCDKMGQPALSSPQTDIGNALEGPIAQLAADRLGVLSMERGTTIQHPRAPLALATPDYWFGFDVGRRTICEVKNVGYRMLTQWGDEDDGEMGVPWRVRIQVAWQMECAGQASALVAALLGGRDLRIYEIAHDQSLADDLLRLAMVWWAKHVVNQTAPDPDGTEAYGQWLQQRHPVAYPNLRKATPGEEGLMLAYRTAQAVAKKAKQEEERTKQAVLAAIGDDTGIEGATGRVTWKTVGETQVPAHVKAAHRRINARWRTHA